MTHATALEGLYKDMARYGYNGGSYDLWGGEDVSLARQGEADSVIVLMMNLHSATCLNGVPRHGTAEDIRGTASHHQPRSRLGNLHRLDVKCTVHGTKHGADHRTIETVFDTPWVAPNIQTEAYTLSSIAEIAGEPYLRHHKLDLVH